MSSNNCSNCHKFSKTELQMVIVDVKTNRRKFGLLCQKCIKKEQEKIGATACSIELNASGKKIFRCPHCGMVSTDQEYFVKHNCVNYVMTKDFAHSLKDDKKWSVTNVRTGIILTVYYENQNQRKNVLVGVPKNHPNMSMYSQVKG